MVTFLGCLSGRQPLGKEMTSCSPFKRVTVCGRICGRISRLFVSKFIFEMPETTGLTICICIVVSQIFSSHCRNGSVPSILQRFLINRQDAKKPRIKRRGLQPFCGLDAGRFAGLTWTHERRIRQLPGLRRADFFEGKEMSALRSLDGGARDFFLCVLGGAVAGRRRAGRLHLSRGLRDAEPDALKFVEKMAVGIRANYIVPEMCG